MARYSILDEKNGRWRSADDKTSDFFIFEVTGIIF